MKPTQKKPSSAPAQISTKDDIWKDIHNWAKPSGSRGDVEDGREDDQITMIGSQLKDNVTEQRMLEGRLMDLSKERYKFIVQMAWQRKAFMDRQKAKTGIMKDLLNGVDTSQGTSNKSRNFNARMHLRHDTYRNLLFKAYSEGQRVKIPTEKNGSSEDNLLEMKPIFPESCHPIFKTEITPSSTKRLQFNSPRQKTLDRRKDNRVNFSAVETDYSGRETLRPGRRTRSQGLITQRQSMPTSFLHGDVHRTNCQYGELREIRSAGSIPKYLKYRAVYDRRFNKLENVLCKPYTEDRVDNMKILLQTLPPVATSSAPPTANSDKS